VAGSGYYGGGSGDDDDIFYTISNFQSVTHKAVAMMII
jgi:hypothetical protein